MLVVYMIFDIIVFENLRFGPSKRKWEAGVFKNLHSEERFCKAALSVTVFTRYVWTGPSFQMSNYRHQNSKIGFNSCNKTGVKDEQSCNRTLLSAKWKFSFKGAFQKSELAGGPWPDQSFWPWNRLFPRVFAKKNDLLPTHHVGFDRSGWMVWINLMTFWLNKATSHATRVEIANTTRPKPWVWLLLVTFLKQWTRRRERLWSWSI